MTKFLLYNLLNYIGYLLSFLAFMYAAKYFFKLPAQKHTTKKEIIFIPLLISVVITSISFIDLSQQRFVSSVLSIIIMLLNTIIFLNWIKKYTGQKDYRIPVILLTFVGCTSNISEMVLQYFWYTYEEWFLSLPAFADFLIDLTWPLPSFFLILLICKTIPLEHGMRQLLDFPRLIYAGGILYYSTEIIIFTINIDIIRAPGMEYLSLYVSGGFLTVLLIVLILLREIGHKYSRSYSEKLLSEQQIYINHVESLYSDLQKLQHDYKNLLSGMYLQVSEGRVEEVKKYLSDNLLSHDEALQNSLKSQKQLGNIKMLEVKSLVLTKMMKAKEHNVTLNLEAANSITGVSISVNDFLRILGIAIDNAIEAAGETSQKAQVDVLFIQENNYVEVVIRNPFKGSIDSDKIWQTGYSTKGVNRGLGLTNYREILDRYHQVLRETKITGNHFTQSISIPM